jgi:hypothetical protein
MRKVRTDITRSCGRCGALAAGRTDWGRYEGDGTLKPFCPDCYASGRVKQTNGKHCCQRCGALAVRHPDWGRCERGGRLKALCPECDRQKQSRCEQANERNALAAAAGYARGWASTPEYHRLQRERNAAKHGRTLAQYLPQRERERRAQLVEAEAFADKIRAQWAADWLRPFRSQSALYQFDPTFREEEKARWRETYARRTEFERARSRAWNTSHPQERLAQQVRRNERLLNGSDGTASAHAVSRLKRRTTHCAYCAKQLTRKETDHMIPVVLGGAHSLGNIVIVCPECNGKKGKLNYAEWIERIAPEHRWRVPALYLERYGEALAA